MRNLFLAIGMAISLFSFGQNKSSAIKFRSHKSGFLRSTIFGFKGGYNASIINGVETNGAKTGYDGGELYGAFFAETRLSENMIFENELLFSWTDDYHFIEVPLHLKLKFSRHISVFAGPKLDFIADPNDDEYEFKHFGVSMELGAQYSFLRRLFIETRYSVGLVRQINDHFLDINDRKRNTFRAGAGVRF